MKSKYPKYEANDMQSIENTMSKPNLKILNDFSEYCRATASEEKVKKIRRIFTQLYDVTEIDLNKQNKESITSFLAVLNNSDRSIPTKNEMKSYLKKFLKWYYKDLQLIEDLNPVLKRENFEVNTKRINESNLITEQDIEKMLRFAQSYKEKAFIFLAFESGARPQEIINLKWKDIKFNDGFADISFYSGKTKQSRIFPVKKAREFLFEWKQNYVFGDRKENDYVFPSRFLRDEPMTTAGLNKILRKLTQKAGLNKDFFSYLFRHTRATKLYQELPTPIVEQLLGHKDMYSTYAHISNEKARQELIDKIYKINKLTPELRDQLEKEIEKQNKAIANLTDKYDNEIVDVKQRDEFVIQQLDEILKTFHGKKVIRKKIKNGYSEIYKDSVEGLKKAYEGKGDNEVRLLSKTKY
jgi:integrase/recombinase XerD